MDKNNKPPWFTGLRGVMLNVTDYKSKGLGSSPGLVSRLKRIEKDDDLSIKKELIHLFNSKGNSKA